MYQQEWMELALKQAKIAQQNNEVPIGAVIIQNGVLIAENCNQKESLKSATAHAEILAINQASKYFGDWRLLETEMYVTMEPCIMCLGAILHSRISRVFYGVPDKKFGGIESIINYNDLKGMNHHTEFYGGYMAEESLKLLRDFFINARKKIKLER